MNDLSVKPKPVGQHGNAKAVCWRYFGQICNSEGKVVDADRIYCSLCLEDQKKLGNKGHLSQVSNFASTTSTSNLNLHLSTKHDIQAKSEEHTTKILSYIKKYSKETDIDIGASSSHEITRDIVIWLCRDLLPFDLVEKVGFQSFSAKVMPQVNIPSSDTLATTALEDVYQAIRHALKKKLESVKSICLMFDGWTDRYKARPYMGVRVAFLDDWKFTVATLGCHVLPSHTSSAIADHISLLLKDYFPDRKKLMIFSCHDGAANMMKTSKILKVDTVQHCVSHGVHLLLTTDSINKIEDVTTLLTKCRNIVTALHFKTLLIEDELASTKDKEIVTNMQKHLAAVSNLLDLDSQFSDALSQNTEENDDLDAETETVAKAKQPKPLHQSLKASCPTRWNSTLFMIESIVQLRRELDNALKRDGRRELCLHEEEFDFLQELIVFLQPFKELTDIFGATQPSLSNIPLMKLKIKKLCNCSPQEDTKMKAIKAAVLAKVDYRFPDTDRIKLHQLLDPETKHNASETQNTTL